MTDENEEETMMMTEAAPWQPSRQNGWSWFGYIFIYTP